MKKIYIILISVLALMAASCGKQDAVYKEFIKDGGFIYPAKPINIEAERGYQRLVLKWDLPMDPSIRTAKLFWDSRTQSMDFDYSAYPDGKVKVVIPDLEDRSYTFEVVNYDSDENASLAAEITSSPFGESWLVSHAERTMLYVEMAGSDAIVTMGKLTDEIVATKFRYTNASGSVVESRPFMVDEDEIKLPNAKKWKYLEYQSAYCPAGGIDTVWINNWTRSPYPVATNVESTATVTVTENQIRDNFKPQLILDGIKDSGTSRWYSSNNANYRLLFPKILVIDTKLSGDNAMTFNHFVFYEDPDPDGQTRRYIRSVNVYVGDTKFNPDDSNYARTFGDPVLTVSLNQLSAVQDFIVSTPKRGRYIALVFRNSYNSSGFVDLWELEAFGYVEKNAN
ncbi:MAG: hypothetical protein IKZ60_07535 [Bacteroidales bacterium]|nr:hypothetical protein [Bacteroidales bacterium]